MHSSQSYWDEDLSIISAENVNFAVETAGLGSRFAAAIVDLTLQLLVASLLSLVSLTGYIPTLWEHSQWIRYLIIAITTLVSFLIFAGYYFFFEWLWDGQTPGKRWVSLRVMQTSGMPLTMWQAMTRNVLRVIDFLPMMYGVGGLVALLNPHNRRVGDLVAGTVVARERRDASRRQPLDINSAVAAFLASMEGDIKPGATAATRSTEEDVLAPSLHSPPSAAPVDAAAAALLVRLDAEDYELTRDFLLRRDKLPQVARTRLAQSLAVRLAVKPREPTPEESQTEAFLESVAATWQQAGRD